MINCIPLFKNKKMGARKSSDSRAIFYQPLFAEIDNTCYAVVLFK